MKSKEKVIDEIKKSSYLSIYEFERKYLDFKNDKEVVLEAVKKDGSILEVASDELKDDEEVVLEAVKKYSQSLIYASDRLKDDKKIVMEAVKKTGISLAYASDRLKDDKEVVLEAVKTVSDYSLKYASDRLKNDKEVVSQAMDCNVFAIEHASDKYKNDKSIALKAVRKNGYALKYVSKELKADKEVVMEAVKQNGLSLEYAPAKLKNDMEISTRAVNQNNKAIEFVGKKIKDSLLNSNSVDISFKDAYQGKLYNFKDGCVCGLALKGNIDIINQIKNKYLNKITIRKMGNDVKITLKEEIKNNYSQIMINEILPVEPINEIIKEYNNVKIAILWYIIEGHFPQLYVLYSEMGDSSITNNKFVAELSAEDDFNPFFEANFIDGEKKKYKYNSSDSHSGYSEKITVEYSFPFIDKWNED